ncbi:MAG: hypothetical protein F4187_01215, partial [Gemmatimonadetes bacterium]|nr:hypothetical protein [Gemmatimonadota bacterium]
MTATRLAAVTVLSVVALTCDITDVVEPPADSLDAGPWLTAEDLPVVQSVSPGVLSLSFRGTEAEILQQMVAYLDLLRAQASGERAENQTEPEDEREPGSLNDDADLRIAPQTIVESDAPRDPDLVLADEPLVRIGVLDGPMEQIFGNITGA